MSQQNGNGLNLNDLPNAANVPELTPEAILIARLGDAAKLFDAELIELLKKHKPANFACVFSYAGDLVLPNEPQPLIRRVSGTKLIGDPAANVGLVMQLQQASKNMIGVR